MTREALLDTAAADTARTWAQSYRHELVREGRLAEGGWPGTLAEARTRVARDAAKALVELAWPALTFEELNRIARITYREAGRVWRTQAPRRRRAAE
jgi:hypothetical protein